MKESQLFPPLKRYLEAQGYTVHGEVKNCDIVARRGEELLVVELKSAISLNLLIQAGERKELSDSVYIAVPVPEGKRVPPNFRRIKGLLRRLEIGCILIDLKKRKRNISVVLQPYPFLERKSGKKRRAVLREIDGRYAEFDLAGQPSKVERISAYKQQALLIACRLKERGPLSPRRLRELGTSERTQSILSANLYGWFDHPERGLYLLNEAGEKALENYVDVLSKIRESFSPRGERE